MPILNPNEINATILSLLHLLADYITIAIENTRYKKLQDMAVRDNLTGLYNQRHLYMSLKRLMARAKKQQQVAIAGYRYG